MSKTSVALVFGGASVEREVSILSARAIAAAFSPSRYEVRLVAIDDQGRLRSRQDSAAILAGGFGAAGDGPAVGSLAFEGCDIAFPIVHGEIGEDGALQGFFEVIGLPYVGSTVAASALGMNKAAFKARAREAGLPVTPSLAVSRGEWETRGGEVADMAIRRIPLPIFVKPSNGGSSLGVSKVKHWEDLGEAMAGAFAYDETVLLEQGIDAREIECAVLGNDDPKASPCGEIVPGREFYDYEDKYVDDGAQLLAPAPLDAGAAGRVRELALRAFSLCGCSGMARVDFFVDRSDGSVYLNELNTLPGFTRISMYPRLWDLAGVPMPSLLDELVRLGFERHRRSRENTRRRAAPPRLT